MVPGRSATAAALVPTASGYSDGIDSGSAYDEA